MIAMMKMSTIDVAVEITDTGRVGVCIAHVPEPDAGGSIKGRNDPGTGSVTAIGARCSRDSRRNVRRSSRL
jgi:hypothetical protein